MTAPSSSSLEIDYYLERVGAALADLPPDVRDDLMEDLPAHFAEVLEEQGGSLVERLGPPAAYAAELRAAAGLDAATRPKRGRLDLELVLEPVTARARVLDERTGRLIGYERATDFLRLLRPAWWIVRGVSLVALIFALDILPTDRFDHPIGWILVAVAVVFSVRVGATGRPRMPRWAGYAVTGLAAIGALVVLVNASRFDVYHYPPEPATYNPYSYVTDVYPVDQSGTPLEGVTLFDQNGNPIVLGDQWRCANNSQPLPEQPTYPMCVRPLRAEPTATPSASPTASPTASPAASPSASPSS
ncbi:HAAS signaling domain-containing protein [Dactylosporangium sp. NPDC048998]|uniref:HAAS signaling domain-containing protein n=1 Tax=Dactylosporangium sp. NPDC048998 TaxID=3363976 RepID=UPI003723DDEE